MIQAPEATIFEERLLVFLSKGAIELKCSIGYTRQKKFNENVDCSVSIRYKNMAIVEDPPAW